MDNFGLVLAAGESRRMGTVKMLMTIGKETILDHVVGRLSMNCSRVLIVVSNGFYQEQTAYMDAVTQRHDSNIIFLQNPSSQEGMHTSFLMGLKQLTDPKSGAITDIPIEFNVFMQPADIPYITPETDRRLTEVATTAPVEDRRGSYFIPSYRHRGGHPICIPAEVCRQIAGKTALDGSVTIRTLLDSFSKRYVEVDDEGILLDIDTPEDYENLVIRRR